MVPNVRVREEREGREREREREEIREERECVPTMSYQHLTIAAHI